jgi:sirohydrochlorin ferrochelatase
MKNLLIVAHGSRREQSNIEINLLAEKVAAEIPFFIDDIHVAFLEFASPSISDVVNRCFTQGVKEIVVLPYFLSAGNHVVKDIPDEINKVMNIWPDRRVTTLPYIGAMDEMAVLIGKCCEGLTNQAGYVSGE